jgi:predicted transcriptional regulator
MPQPLDPAHLVRAARGRAHLTQRELARRAGTSQSVVARIEAGQTDPGSATLVRILTAAGFEVRAELVLRPALDMEMLDDVPRILALTPEQRLIEARNLSRFEAAARRV